SALAARHLARPDAQRLLVVGSGRLAGWLARAHAALRPGLTQIQVWARRPQAAEALAVALRSEGLPAQAATDLEAAVRQAGIISCATTSSEPVVLGDWLAPGTHLDLVGSFTPAMREVDDTAVQRARVAVDTFAGALAEAGDLVQPLRAGLIERSHVVAELADLVRGAVVGRRTAQEITLFKSVGTALEDLAAACMVTAAQAAP
ncbi:MAG: ornithine cyclodeaminase family protein, partial [Rubrivivax sp.]|nr:ornithine cyclodeaminase family protein [Rubrivivax sp.]